MSGDRAGGERGLGGSRRPTRTGATPRAASPAASAAPTPPASATTTTRLPGPSATPVGLQRSSGGRRTAVGRRTVSARRRRRGGRRARRRGRRRRRLGGLGRGGLLLDPADDVRQRREVAQLERVLARDVVGLAHGGEGLGLLHGVDAEVGLEVEVEVEHVRRVAGLLGDDGEHARRLTSSVAAAKRARRRRRGRGHRHGRRRGRRGGCLGVPVCSLDPADDVRQRREVAQLERRRRAGCRRPRARRRRSRPASPCRRRGRPRGRGRGRASPAGSRSSRRRWRARGP